MKYKTVIAILYLGFFLICFLFLGLLFKNLILVYNYLKYLHNSRSLLYKICRFQEAQYLALYSLCHSFPLPVLKHFKKLRFNFHGFIFSVLFLYVFVFLFNCLTKMLHTMVLYLVYNYFIWNNFYSMAFVCLFWCVCFLKFKKNCT